MRNQQSYLSFSLLALCSWIAAILAITYIALLAVVMNYAALTVEYSQSVRNKEAEIAKFESKYLSAIARIATTDYIAEGYVQPINKTFVRTNSATALR